jgi:anti-sigma regulatory factor (Ser/Thr protein kinase)
MPRIDIASLTPWITRAAILHGSHGNELPAQLMQHLGISRRRAGHVLRKLVALQWLVAEGTPRKPLYRPGPLRQVVQRYALEGLQEDLPWRRDFAPFFALPAEVARMAQHAFTELLNNAVDHSGGSQVTVSMRQTPLQLQLLVSDDGVGLFERIAGSFAIDDPMLAMLELSKGKLTSLPQRHSGHGLFFSSRLADVFDIHANRSAFQHRAWEAQAWRPGKASAANTRPGTSVYLAIALETPRTLDGVLKAHSDSGAGYDFARTRVPLHLIAGGASDAALLSRADARRAAQRLAQFKRAELDFTGVAHIGHGFADELFRVCARDNPELTLLPVGAVQQVAAMIDSVRAAA